jgi:hypothetical protein
MAGDGGEASTELSAAGRGGMGYVILDRFNPTALY